MRDIRNNTTVENLVEEFGPEVKMSSAALIKSVSEIISNQENRGLYSAREAYAKIVDMMEEHY